VEFKSSFGTRAYSFLNFSPIFLFMAAQMFSDLGYAGSDSGGVALSSNFLVNPPDNILKELVGVYTGVASAEIVVSFLIYSLTYPFSLAASIAYSVLGFDFGV
jgi:hypothetical protein